jgi:hypothetical protein
MVFKGTLIEQGRLSANEFSNKNRYYNIGGSD